MLIVIGYSFIPYYLHNWVLQKIAAASQVPDAITKDAMVKAYYFQEALKTAYITRFLLALLLSLKFIPFNFVRQQMCGLSTLLIPNNIKRTSKIKLAAVYKIHNLLKNAQQLHFVTVPNSDKNPRVSSTTSRYQVKDVMANFLNNGKRIKAVSTMKWRWRQLGWSTQIIQKEGVWIHSRLIGK